jgi:hypothetical protein
VQHEQIPLRAHRLWLESLPALQFCMAVFWTIQNSSSRYLGIQRIGASMINFKIYDNAMLAYATFRQNICIDEKLSSAPAIAMVAGVSVEACLETWVT